MKNFKRIITLVLAAILTLSLCVISASADDAYTITIDGANTEAGHTYEAYQIFAGDLNEDGTTLSNITWGSGVNGAALLAALQDETAFAACTSAADVAEVLDGYANDAANTQAFAKIVGEYLATAAGTSTEDDAPYTIGNLNAGYYLVKDQNASVASDSVYTRYILKVVNDVTVDAKASKPSIDKNILENDVKVKANTAAIGDKIDYVIDSTVPDMTGYETYFFVLNDTMTKGLTFNNDVEITIGDTTLTANDYTVIADTDDTTGETSITIAIKNFINYTTGDAIAVTYSATLNQDADLTPTGNINEVELVYSNNPNVDSTGKPGHPELPGDDDVVGTTPSIDTKTFSTAAKLIKVDANDNTKTLTGAKFSISGTALNVVLINKEIFEEDANGTYYMLKDGTYTTEAATELTADKYDSTTTLYSKITVVDKDTVATDFQTEGYVDENGELLIEGLNAGTYTITELVEPDGYNKLTAPITLVVTDHLNTTAKTCAWTATVDGESADIIGNVITFTVENSQGSVLPSTGGAGLVAIYVVGSILVLAAVVLLVSKKRMHNDD